MFKKMLQKIGVLVTLMLIVALAGCGTTVDQITEDSGEEEVVIAEMTQILNREGLHLRPDDDYEGKYLIKGDWDSVPANSTIEVYRSSYFTKDNIVAVQVASEAGSFMIEQICESNGSTYYITAIEPGKRRSIAVRLSV